MFVVFSILTSLVAPSFHFNYSEGYVGEPMLSQLWLTSNAQEKCSPTQISKVTLSFEGHLGPITLSHQNEPNGSSTDRSDKMTVVLLKKKTTIEGTNVAFPLEGQTQLNIYPGQTRVYEFQFIPREAGSVTALSTKLEVHGHNFNFTVETPFSAKAVPTNVWLAGSCDFKKSSARGSLVAKILPKPPKIETRFSELERFYYTDEAVSLDVEVLNNEDEEAYTSLEVQLVGHDQEPIDYTWIESSKIDTRKPDDSFAYLPGHELGLLMPSTATKMKLSFVSPSIQSLVMLEVKASYYLKSDLQTVLTKSSIVRLEITEPFKIDFQFNPRIHPAPWPNYFDFKGSNADGDCEAEDGKNSSQQNAGLMQKWLLQARITSLANESITFENTSATLHDVNGGITCRIEQEPPFREMSLRKGESLEWYFILDTQKLSIEDRNSSSVDMNIIVAWRRSHESKAGESKEKRSVATTIEVPRLPIPSSEPRVLATARLSTSMPDTYVLEYVLENPTMHFLTFDLAMEASEDFAFSGCKYGTMNLLPISRQTLRVHVLPLIQGVWIRPQLRIADRYFNKTLKVLPTVGLAADKNGLILYADDAVSWC